ncbi:MAG TPA: penicillin-binding protein 2 [Terriglobales bacterium]|nr:penicillin-binding protein 2 [Terriglobales bacterium]
MVFGREDKVSPIRITGVQYVILLVFLLLGYGFWRLQVADSDYYASLAEQNRIRKVPILAPRGKILDREGRVIVDNYPSFSALLLRDQTRDLNADVDKIATGLHMDPEDIRTRIKRFEGMPQYQPLILKDDITPDELAYIEAHKNELPELDTIRASRRLYPKNGFMAHVIGYVGEVSEEMLDQPQWEFYKAGDVVGKSGVELEYNDILMGQDGSRREVVNSRGRVMRQLDEVPATPGKPLKLTIDLDLQIAAEQALGDKDGAIIAMNPKTGEILAMVSRPTFDPNSFAVRISRDEWNRLVTDEGKPLMNKAIQAQLAPGSTFKIIMATAGLQEGIAENMKVNCTGGASFYGRYFKCWISARHQTHGIVDISKGIYQSCDVFFYTLAERLGIGTIAKWATRLGIGQRTGIDLPQEASGVMPSEEWKIRNFKQKWYAGETISVGIGQGAVAVTPVQLLRAISGITMDGRLVRPHVVDYGDIPTDLQARYKQVSAKHPDLEQVDIDPKNWETITDAMANVTTPLGTAGSAHIQGVDFAGKTGTAQLISNQGKARLSNGKAQFKDNGWFVGVEPRRDPEIAVVVLFQGGEEGYYAARIASQVVKAYVDEQRGEKATQTNVAQAHPVPPPTAAEVEDGEGPAPENPTFGSTATVPSEQKPVVVPSSDRQPGAKPMVKPATKKPAIPEAKPSSSPSQPGGTAELHAPAAIPEMAGIWTVMDEDGEEALRSARFSIQPGVLKRATAAPGMN